MAGSPIVGIRETQEMLDFCARKGILPACEMIRMDKINDTSPAVNARTCAIAS